MIGSASRVVLALATVAALATMATAGPFVNVTDTASFGALGLAPGAGPPIPGTFRIGVTDGNVYANHLGPLAVGTRVNLVGAMSVATADSASTGSNHSVFTPQLGRMVAIFGVSGTIVDISGTSTTALFDTGRLQITGLDPLDGFAGFDATTWGFNGAVGQNSGNPATILAEYTLKGQEAIVSGNNFGITGAEAINEPASVVNVSSANITIPGFGQGLFLFEEGPPAFSQNLLNSDSGLAAILGAFAINESLVVDTAQEVLAIDESDPLPQGLSAAEEAVLNAIGNYAFSAPFADFAGATADPFDDFDVVLQGGVPQDGPAGPDFIGRLNGAANPAIQAAIIPEPTTWLIWVALGSVAVCFARQFYGRQ